MSELSSSFRSRRRTGTTAFSKTGRISCQNKKPILQEHRVPRNKRNLGWLSRRFSDLEAHEAANLNLVAKLFLDRTDVFLHRNL